MISSKLVLVLSSYFSQVQLDKKLLHSSSGSGGHKLIFNLWGSPSTSSEEGPCNDRMLGFSIVDLSVLNAGLRAINGWYNIIDVHENCLGQLKLAVTPTQVVSPPRSFPKHSRFTLPAPETSTQKEVKPSSSSASFQPTFARTAFATALTTIPDTITGPSSSGLFSSKLQDQIKELERIKSAFQEKREAVWKLMDKYQSPAADENETPGVVASSSKNINAKVSTEQVLEVANKFPAVSAFKNSAPKVSTEQVFQRHLSPDVDSDPEVHDVSDNEQQDQPPPQSPFSACKVRPSSGSLLPETSHHSTSIPSTSNMHLPHTTSTPASGLRSNPTGEMGPLIIFS